MFGDMIDDDLILQRIQHLPGVRAAALTATAPVMGGRIWMSTIDVRGYTPAPEENMTAKVNAVTPDYFAAAGIALRAGRVFGAADEAGTEPVAVVSETFARRFLAGRNPVGAVVDRGADSFRIIGVVEDARYSNLRNPEIPYLYLSSAQKAGTEAEPLVLLVRTAGAPADLAELVQREMLASGQTVVIRNVADMQTAINASLVRERMAAILGTLFGLLALALAALGLYGVIAYQVAGRTTEIGTRMALGARSSRVVWLVLRQSMVVALDWFRCGRAARYSGGSSAGHTVVRGAGVRSRDSRQCTARAHDHRHCGEPAARTAGDPGGSDDSVARIVISPAHLSGSKTLVSRNGRNGTAKVATSSRSRLGLEHSTSTIRCSCPQRKRDELRCDLCVPVATVA